MPKFEKAYDGAPLGAHAPTKREERNDENKNEKEVSLEKKYALTIDHSRALR